MNNEMGPEEKLKAVAGIRSRVIAHPGASLTFQQSADDVHRLQQMMWLCYTKCWSKEGRALTCMGAAACPNDHMVQVLLTRPPELWFGLMLVCQHLGIFRAIKPALKLYPPPGKTC